MKLKRVILICFAVFMVGCSSVNTKTDSDENTRGYIVQRGETLYSIGKRYGISSEELKKLNNLKDNNIFAGQKIRVPRSVKEYKGDKKSDQIEYVVQRGDNLHGLARTFGISVEEIKSLNHLDSDKILPGDVLLVKGERVDQSDIERKLSKFKNPMRTGTVVTSSYGQRIHPISGKKSTHAGIDIGAPKGTPIYSPADGTVSYAGWMNGYGKILIIDHGDTVTTRHAHLNKMYVEKGTKVKQGEQVAEVGATGRVTGPHLHYEIRIANKHINPKPYMN